MYQYLPILIIAIILAMYKKYNNRADYNTLNSNNISVCDYYCEKSKNDSECNKYKILDVLPDKNGCYLYENTNRTQMLYMKLRDIFGKLSHEKSDRRKLENCKRNVYIQGTTSNRLKTEIDEINCIILKKINNGGFAFKQVFLDTITEFVDPNGNKNFKYLLFIYDPNEELSLRLFIDVIKYSGKINRGSSKLPTCTSVSSPGMDTFEIGYPQPEQLLPLPTQTVNTGVPDLLSADGINIKHIAPIRGLFINEIKIYNTDAVINANGQCLMEGVCGNIKDTSLSSSAFNQPTTPFQEPACVRNKWPILPDQPTGVKAWPCGSVSPYWNTLGIPIDVSPNTQYTGIRSSTVNEPVVGEFYPTLATIPRNSGPNAWLFSLVRGDVSTEGASFTP